MGIFESQESGNSEVKREENFMSVEKKDIKTLKQISEKYGIPYNTLYKEVVRKNAVPFVRFGGIKISENAFRNIFMQKGFAI